MNISGIRELVINDMVENGHLIRHGELLEDMGGHFINENCTEMIDSYVEDYLKNHLTKREAFELFKKGAQ